MSDNNSNNQVKQRQSLDRSHESLMKEQRIFDDGYGAIRKMAAKMVQNGATLADVLFHANQVWHEFKAGAFSAGCFSAGINGMYINEYKPEVTKSVLTGDERYTHGVDEVRVAFYANNYRGENSKEQTGGGGQ